MLHEYEARICKIHRGHLLRGYINGEKPTRLEDMAPVNQIISGREGASKEGAPASVGGDLDFMMWS